MSRPPRRTVIEQLDPEHPAIGGVPTCLDGIAKYGELELEIVGAADPVSDRPVGEWVETSLGGRPVRFLPVTRLRRDDQNRRIPHSVRMMAGLLRYRHLIVPQLVQTHRIELGMFCLHAFRDVPVVQFLHTDGLLAAGSQSDSFWRRWPSAYRRVERHVLARTTDAVSFSPTGCARLAAESLPVRFSPTWYDPDEFHPSTVDRGGRTVGGSVRLLWAGRIEQPKDPLLAIEVLARAPEDVSLTIAGRGELAADVQALAEARGLSGRVHMVGSVGRTELARLMVGHHALLLTSHFEGFPRVLVEGLACGLPAVATSEADTGGLIVDGVNGCTVSGRDPGALAGAVFRVLGLDPEECVASVRHLSAPVVVPQVLEVPIGART